MSVKNYQKVYDPKTEGHYWVRRQDTTDKFQIVRVVNGRIFALVGEQLPLDTNKPLEWYGPIEPPDVLKFEVTFYTEHGHSIETFVDEIEPAMRAIERFILLHGTDPDDDGEDAKPGRVYFRPVRGMPTTPRA